MLEKIVQGIVTAEMYSIRVADECIHAKINSAAQYVEGKGLPRIVQARMLSALSGFGFLFYFGQNSFREISNTKQHPSIPFTRGASHILAAYGFATLDQVSLSGMTAQNNGTLANQQVFSYGSYSGIIRPYVFAASLMLVAHGIWKQDGQHLQYGLLSLPYALSLYVRDSQSGGLLEKIKAGMRSLFAQPVAYIPGR